MESGDARYPTSISSGGPSWKDTRRSPPDRDRAGVGLKRSGFAKGRVGRRGVSIPGQPDLDQLTTGSKSYLRGHAVEDW